MSNEMVGGDGTKQSGYVTWEENKGPRQCSNCIFYSQDRCHNEVVENDPELIQLRDEDGVKVEDKSCCNLYMSKLNAIVYLVRHGETKANKQEQFRGWIEVPLNKDGIKQAKNTKKFIENKGIKEVYCSDLGRAQHTAQLIMPSKRSEKDPLLRPWDIGTFSGKDRDVYQPALNHFIDSPETPIPDGESLKEFADRQMKAFKKYTDIAKKNGPILIVAHASNIIQWEKITEGKDELGRPEDVDRVSPGGVFCILDEGGRLKSEIPFGEVNESPANYGS